ncbi:hypothetical protein CEXT_128021 [Caerostris extrusa]|uniref:Uncharacterized protein n=1 Tax=Caerostris extrusa TaxID=172846 RepID=A0AAV4SN19_CAEEX|nr:hypothetical protein CEXT_128021 [Caerostris extrusa]
MLPQFCPGRFLSPHNLTPFKSLDKIVKRIKIKKKKRYPTTSGIHLVVQFINQAEWIHVVQPQIPGSASLRVDYAEDLSKWQEGGSFCSNIVLVVLFFYCRSFFSFSLFFIKVKFCLGSGLGGLLNTLSVRVWLSGYEMQELLIIGG